MKKFKICFCQKNKLQLLEKIYTIVLESKYKKISKFEEVMVQNQKKMSDFKWNASPDSDKLPMVIS
jgi:hypothetical protein